MMEPIDAQTTAANEPDIVQDSLDALHDDIEDLKQRIEAILIAAIHSALRQKLMAQPAVYDRVQLTVFEPPRRVRIAAAGKVDMVLPTDLSCRCERSPARSV
jgi:hypothetical protein